MGRPRTEIELSPDERDWNDAPPSVAAPVVEGTMVFNRRGLPAQADLVIDSASTPVTAFAYDEHRLPSEQTHGAATPGAYPRTEAADPMREEPAPMVPTLPADRVANLNWTYDWLANMSEWTDDAQSFYERSLGATVTNGHGEAVGSDAARPSALYLASNLPTSAPTPAAGLDRGGWLELERLGIPRPPFRPARTPTTVPHAPDHVHAASLELREHADAPSPTLIAPRAAVVAAHLAADDPGRVLDALTYGSPDLRCRVARSIPRTAA